MVTVELFNNVGESGGITVETVKSFLNANKANDVQFDISTLGGELATAITIHDLIKTHPKRTVANIIGLTASAGTVIAIACDEVNMSDNALFLIHNGWKEVVGNVYDMQKAASQLMQTDAIMVKMYKEKTGIEENIISEIMKESDWLSPVEALEYGFVDKIVQCGMKIAASLQIEKAKGKINDLLLIKLSEKMIKNPFKAPQAKVEEAPKAAIMLEDGEYTLDDGRKIVVKDGIAEVKEPEIEAAVEPQAPATTDEIVAAVSALISPVMAEIDTLKTAMASISSTHKPAKTSTVGAGNASVQMPVASKLQDITDGIRKKFVESRTV